MAQLDRTDQLVIRCLQDNPRASYAEIARLTGISETTVRRRVDACMSSGMISAAIIPSVLQMGYHATAYVGLKLDLVRLDQIIESISILPEITVAVATLGRYDMILQIAQRTPEGLTDYIARNIAVIEGVRDVEVMMATKAVKMFRHWRVPLDLTESDGDPNSNSDDTAG